jgi:hypothetical protein
MSSAGDRARPGWKARTLANRGRLFSTWRHILHRALQAGISAATTRNAMKLARYCPQTNRRSGRATIDIAAEPVSSLQGPSEDDVSGMSAQGELISMEPAAADCIFFMRSGTTTTTADDSHLFNSHPLNVNSLSLAQDHELDGDAQSTSLSSTMLNKLSVRFSMDTATSSCRCTGHRCCRDAIHWVVWIIDDRCCTAAW